MADNILIRPSAAENAKPFAADDVGGVLYQVLKLAYGADGAAQIVDTAHALPVVDAAVADALTSLQTELSQKLEAADLAALATGSKQDAAKTVLDAISAALAHGTFGYAAGTTATTVDVPSGARVKRVSVIPASSGGAATVTIAGGSTITIPAGSGFDEQIAGDVTAGGDVVIGGNVASYYVSWVS